MAAGNAAEAPRSRGELADDVLDGMLPEQLDWRHVVRTYPIPSMLAVAAAGFLLGRRRGWELVEALTDYSARQVVRGVNEELGEEVL